MTKAHDTKELAAAMDLAAESRAENSGRARHPRGREIEVSVLGNEDPKASIPGEIVPHANSTTTPQNISKKAHIS